MIDKELKKKIIEKKYNTLLDRNLGLKLWYYAASIFWKPCEIVNPLTENWK